MTNYKHKGRSFTDVLRILDTLETWEQWQHFSETFFEVATWPHSDSTSAMEDIDETVLIDHAEWQPFVELYSVDPRLRVMYEESRLAFFEKMEPEAAEKNRCHPERYGLFCYRCSLWTREHRFATCPTCNLKLVSICLNED